MKRWFILLMTILIMIALVSCSGSKMTYEKLTNEQKEIVDFLVSKYSVWGGELIQVSGTEYEGAPALFVEEKDSGGTNVTGCWMKTYLYNIHEETIDCVAQRYVGMVTVLGDGSVNGKVDSSWHRNMSETEIKDRLAGILFSNP